MKRATRRIHNSRTCVATSVLTWRPIHRRARPLNRPRITQIRPLAMRLYLIRQIQMAAIVMRKCQVISITIIIINLVKIHHNLNTTVIYAQLILVRKRH